MRQDLVTSPSPLVGSSKLSRHRAEMSRKQLTRRLGARCRRALASIEAQQEPRLALDGGASRGVGWREEEAIGARAGGARKALAEGLLGHHAGGRDAPVGADLDLHLNTTVGRVGAGREVACTGVARRQEPRAAHGLANTVAGTCSARPAGRARAESSRAGTRQRLARVRCAVCCGGTSRRSSSAWRFAPIRCMRCGACRRRASTW